MDGVVVGGEEWMLVLICNVCGGVGLDGVCVCGGVDVSVDMCGGVCLCGGCVWRSGC